MTDFYDGPLAGIVEYKGNSYWYEVVSNFVNEQTRYFALVALSGEEYDTELHWHRRFENYVSEGLTEEKVSEWKKTYSVYQKPRESNYENKGVATWFQMY